MILDREAAFAAVGQPVEKLYIIVTSMYQNFLTTYHAKIQPVLTNAHFIPCEHLVYFPEVTNLNGCVLGPSQFEIIYISP